MGPNDREDDEPNDSITHYEESLQQALEDSIKEQTDDSREHKDDKD